MAALDLHEEPLFQEREWRAKRWSWAALALLLALAAAGLFGDGPLSLTTATGPGIGVEYERFWRNGAPTSVSITFAGESRTVFIGEAFWDGVEISGIDPEPVRARLAPGGREIDFASKTGRGASRVRLRFVPRTIGRLRAEIRVASGSIALSSFVYP